MLRRNKLSHTLNARRREGSHPLRRGRRRRVRSWALPPQLDAAARQVRTKEGAINLRERGDGGCGGIEERNGGDEGEGEEGKERVWEGWARQGGEGSG